MNSKIVSIIIPTFKTNGGIVSSIDSALSQTYKNIEVIVVDDNDPKSEYRLLTERYMSKYQFDSRVRYIQHDENKNGAVARNTGIKASCGQYIAFLDDDDVFYPTKIEQQLAYLEKNHTVDGVYSFISINGKPIVITPYDGNAILPLMTERTRMFTSTLMFRKHAIIDIGGFTEAFQRHQDFDLLIKFFYSGYKIGCIEEILADYSDIGRNRLHGKSLEALKAQYLSQFSYVIESLEKKYRGSKKKIIANNYASVFVSYIAMREFRLANNLFWKYINVSPFDFIAFLFFFAKGQVKKKMFKN